MEGNTRTLGSEEDRETETERERERLHRPVGRASQRETEGGGGGWGLTGGGTANERPAWNLTPATRRRTGGQMAERGGERGRRERVHVKCTAGVCSRAR